MSSVERVANLDAQLQYCFDLQWLASDHVPEDLPLQQFHRYECFPVGFINLVNRADVRVVQRGRSFGLPREAAEGLWMGGEFAGKNLEADMAPQLQIFCLVHNPHTPTADFAEYPVVGDCLGWGLGKAVHWRGMLRGSSRG